MSDIKLQPLQLERLLGVLNEQNEYESEMSRQMSTWGPIPKTKNKSAQIIKKIFNSSGYDFYQLGDDINLDTDPQNDDSDGDGIPDELEGTSLGDSEDSTTPLILIGSILVLVLIVFFIRIRGGGPKSLGEIDERML